MNYTTILQGDALDLLPTLPRTSVQCIPTSPPYYGLRDYGLPASQWPEVDYAPMAGLPMITIPAQTVCLGLEDNVFAYVGHLVYLFRLLREVLTDNGVIWLNLGDSYANPSKWGGASSGKNATSAAGAFPRSRRGRNGFTAHDAAEVVDAPHRRPQPGMKDKDLYGIPHRVVFALQADGWYWRSENVWHKPNGMPESVEDRTTRNHEMVFQLTKSEHYFYDHKAIAEPAKVWPGPSGTFKRNGSKRGAVIVPGQSHGTHRPDRADTEQDGTRNCRSVWSIPTKALNEAHYAPMPEALAERCIRAASRPGDVILDPFAGTGTVVRVAERLQRVGIGIDLNADYVAIAERRTNGVQLQMVEV